MKGRLLVFQVTSRRLQLISEKEILGAAYCMLPFDGKLLVGVNAKVHLFSWSDKESSSSHSGRSLTSLCSHHGHVLSLFITSRGEDILVGDLMRSITLLRYKPLEQRIEEVARDYNPLWVTAIDIMDNGIFLAAENSHNLVAFTASSVHSGKIGDEEDRLLTVGEYHLGDFVNKFTRGTLAMKLPESDSLKIKLNFDPKEMETDDDPKEHILNIPSNLPSTIFGTIGGSIGVIAQLPQDIFVFLQRMQFKMQSTLSGVGKLKHDVFRTFSNERRVGENKGFIDGDFIESYLDLPQETMTLIADGIGVSAKDLTKIVEAIQRATH